MRATWPSHCVSVLRPRGVLLWGGHSPVPACRGGTRRGSYPYGQKIRTARQVGQFMPLSVGSPRVVGYVVWGDQWWPLRTGGQMGELMEWARILAYISGTVDQE